MTVKEDDRRRIDNPKDLVRREIAIALKRKIVVIPLLVQDAAMPNEDDLPGLAGWFDHQTTYTLPAGLAGENYRWQGRIALLA